VLGGLTVLFLLPRPVSIAHASVAQLFFCLTVSLALFTSPGWQQEHSLRRECSEPSLRRLAAVTTIAVFLQLILGAAYRHDAAGIVPHLVGAALVTIGVIWVWRRIRREYGDEPALRRPATVLASLLLFQLVLGGAAYWVRLATAEAPQPQLLMVVLTVTHVATGALVLASSLVVTLQAYSRLASTEAKPAMVSAAQNVAS